MIKTWGVVWTMALASAALALTQEELAQYVARQQTAETQVGAGGQARRQAYALGGAPPGQAYQVPARQAYQQAAPEQVQQYYQPQPQPQQYYQPQAQPQFQAQPQQKKLARPAAPSAPGQVPEEFESAPNYQFGFNIKDDDFTNYQQRKEQREGNKITGSYSVVDSDGFLRTVTYTADPLEGFKADVQRKPTDIKIKFPQIQQQQQPQQLQQPQYESQPQQYDIAARKQQTQQYLQGSAGGYSPEQAQLYSGGAHAQQLRQVAPQAYQGQEKAKSAEEEKGVEEASALGFAQLPQTGPIQYQAYQQ